MIATAPASAGECIFDDARRFDIMLFARDDGACFWVVRLDGRTAFSGGAEDMELGRLKAERFVEDQIDGRRGAAVIL